MLISEIKYYDAVQRLRYMDDVFMNECFDGNIPCVQFILRIILNDESLNITRVESQAFVKGWGRSVEFDVLCEDDKGRGFDIEVQRSDTGAELKRSRYYSSMMDYGSLNARNKFRQLRDNYVIFITEHDVLKGGLPLYTINRRIDENGQLAGDGSHIIYVNASHQDTDTPLGRLMHDFMEPDPKKMYYPILAETAGFYKSDGLEVKKMGGVIDELINEGRDELIRQGREEGREEGSAVTTENFAVRMLKAGKLAVEDIAEYSGLSVVRIKGIADSLGIACK